MRMGGGQAPRVPGQAVWHYLRWRKPPNQHLIYEKSIINKYTSVIRTDTIKLRGL